MSDDRMTDAVNRALEALGVKHELPANGVKSTTVMHRGPNETLVEYTERAFGVKPESPVNGANSTTVMHRGANETLVEYTERAFGVKPESPTHGANSTSMMPRGPNESPVEFVERALGIEERNIGSQISGGNGVKNHNGLPLTPAVSGKINGHKTPAK